MPNRNGIGPQGAGHATGRGMGPCGRGSRQGRANRIGRGLGAFSRQKLSNEDEKKLLENEEDTLKQELAQVQKEKKLLRISIYNLKIF